MIWLWLAAYLLAGAFTSVVAWVRLVLRAPHEMDVVDAMVVVGLCLSCLVAWPFWFACSLTLDLGNRLWRARYGHLTDDGSSPSQ